MYFGLSFGRVGFDFRPLLAPIFSSAVEKQFKLKLSSSSAVKTVSESLSSLSLSSLPAAPGMMSVMTSSAVSPPLSLLEYPPLAHVTNNILTALNEIRWTSGREFPHLVQLINYWSAGWCVQCRVWWWWEERWSHCWPGSPQHWLTTTPLPTPACHHQSQRDGVNCAWLSRTSSCPTFRYQVISTI